MIETIHQVTLFNCTPLKNAIYGARTCTATSRHGVRDDDPVLNFCINAGHWSVLEHINYTLCIRNISRALLQQIARHRHTSLSVESTRYTLQMLKKRPKVFMNMVGRILTFALNNPTEAKQYAQHYYNMANLLEANYTEIINLLDKGMSNDELKYFLPECHPTSLTITLNARALMELFQKRTGKEALKEFRFLCLNIYKELPKEHKEMYKDVTDWKALEYYFIRETLVHINKTTDTYPVSTRCEHF